MTRARRKHVATPVPATGPMRLECPVCGHAELALGRLPSSRCIRCAMGPGVTVEMIQTPREAKP